MKNVLYLVDDNILFFSKKFKKILKYKINNKALKNGKIANTKLFITSYKKFLNTYKLNNNIFGDTLTIIVNPEYTKVDIDIITNVFASLNYRKTNIVNEIKLYKLNGENAYLNYNQNYMILLYQDEFKEKKVFLIEQNFFTVEELIKFIKQKISNRNIFCFGLNKDIDEFIKKLETNSQNTGYHFANDESYIIDLFLKKRLAKNNNSMLSS